MWGGKELPMERYQKREGKNTHLTQKTHDVFLTRIKYITSHPGIATSVCGVRSNYFYYFQLQILTSKIVTTDQLSHNIMEYPV